MESVKKCDKKAAFTIVELLTVMSIIVILMGLVLPALNKVRIYAKDVKQQAQFHSIEIAMDLYYTEMDGYPESNFENVDPEDYCGAHKLCEAMMGMDLLGLHPDSLFKSDGEDASNNKLYSSPTNVLDMTDPDNRDNLRSRKGPYLDLNNANTYKMSDIYGLNIGSFYEDNLVMCDVYTNVTNQGLEGKSKIGMPILYYKANVSKLSHDPNEVPLVINTTHIYNFWDNDELVQLGAPFYGTGTPSDHPLHIDSDGYIGKRFYEQTMDDRITSILQFRPCRPDSYILISAGYDGLYGTEDDICNFSN